MQPKIFVYKLEKGQREVRLKKGLKLLVVARNGHYGNDPSVSVTP